MKKRCLVIGSGLAGTLIANQMSSYCDVSVLEAGPENAFRYPKVRYLNKELAHVATFCHGAGGGTNLWHNGLIPINPDDVSAPSFRRVLDDARRYIDKAASLLHFTSESYCREVEALSGDVEKLGREIGNFPDGIDSLIYPKSFSPLKLATSVQGYYEVSDIQFDTGPGGVSGVRFTRCGKTTNLAADFVVISCGALGTPGVLTRLLRSIGRSTDRIGTGFIDHPMGFVGKFRFPKSIAASVNKFSLLDKGDYESRNVIRLKSDCGNYTGCAFFRPTITMNNDLSIYIYKSLLGASKGNARLRNALSPKILHPDILAEIVSHLFPFDIPSRTYSVLFMGEQRRGSNRVFNSEDGLTIDWSIRDDEISIYDGMIRRLQEMLVDSAEESVIQSELTPDWLWSGAHHSGTTPLGDSDTDVVDENLQVKGTENVFVCDGSVIQEHSYANTGLTIGQLALRLVDFLRAL